MFTILTAKEHNFIGNCRLGVGPLFLIVGPDVVRHRSPWAIVMVMHGPHNVENLSTLSAHTANS